MINIIYDFRMTTAKGKPWEFELEHYVYLLRARDVADSQPVTISNLLSKFGFIEFLEYGMKGQVKDFTQIERGNSSMMPGFCLTLKGEAALTYFKPIFTDYAKILKEMKRQCL